MTCLYTQILLGECFLKAGEFFSWKCVAKVCLVKIPNLIFHLFLELYFSHAAWALVHLISWCVIASFWRQRCTWISHSLLGFKREGNNQVFFATCYHISFIRCGNMVTYRPTKRKCHLSHLTSYVSLFFLVFFELIFFRVTKHKATCLRTSCSIDRLAIRANYKNFFCPRPTLGSNQ